MKTRKELNLMKTRKETKTSTNPNFYSLIKTEIAHALRS
jgi:hypothetical protein